MEGQFGQVKQEYDNFYRQLLTMGRLPMKDTGKGFWGVSLTDEVFEAFRKVRLERFRTFFDLGAGDGKVVMIASLFGPDAKGMELDDELVQHANRIKARLSHIPQLQHAAIEKGDYEEHDLSAYDFLFINPDRPFHRGLEQKLLREMKDEALLMVYGFEYQPNQMRKINSFTINGTHIGLFMK